MTQRPSLPHQQTTVGLLRPAGVAATAPEIARSILAIQCNAHAIRNADGHVLGLGYDVW